MRKVLLITSLLALMFIGAYARPTKHKLVRLIIVNKSGLPVEVQLTGLTGIASPSGVEVVNSYYFRIPKGNKIAPTERSFTIVPDYYTVQPYYIPLWDPVYGSTCGAMVSKTLDLTRNKPVKIYMLPCNRRVPKSDTQIKFGNR